MLALEYAWITMDESHSSPKRAQSFSWATSIADITPQPACPEKPLAAPSEFPFTQPTGGFSQRTSLIEGAFGGWYRWHLIPWE